MDQWSGTLIYYMASSVSGQDEPNRSLWLAYYLSFYLHYLQIIITTRLLMKKGWFLDFESKLGKSFKVSV